MMPAVRSRLGSSTSYDPQKAADTLRYLQLTSFCCSYVRHRQVPLPPSPPLPPSVLSPSRRASCFFGACPSPPPMIVFPVTLTLPPRAPCPSEKPLPLYILPSPLRKTLLPSPPPSLVLPSIAQPQALALLYPPHPLVMLSRRRRTLGRGRRPSREGRSGSAQKSRLSAPLAAPSAAQSASMRSEPGCSRWRRYQRAQTRTGPSRFGPPLPLSSSFPLPLSPPCFRLLPPVLPQPLSLLPFLSHPLLFSSLPPPPCPSPPSPSFLVPAPLLSPSSLCISCVVLPPLLVCP